MEINAYLGQKGYTISKNELTVEKQKQIRNNLMLPLSVIPLLDDKNQILLYFQETEQPQNKTQKDKKIATRKAIQQLF